MSSEEWVKEDGVANLVSIVVPTHNRDQLLKETLTSLIRQTYRPLEIIVVDDGSDDGTAEVVASLSSESEDDCRIQYVRQSAAGGPAARNTGAKQSTGEFVVFMDDDDLVAPGFLQSRVESLQANPDAGFAFGLWHLFDVVDGTYRTLSIRGGLPASGKFDWYAFITNDWELLLQGCVLRRKLVSRAGPWQVGLHKSQDLEYKARLIAAELGHIFVDSDPVYYRLHGASISGVITRKKLDSYVEVVDQLEAMSVEREDYESNADRVADFLWHHSFWLYGEGEFALGRRQLLRAKAHAKRICQRKGFFASALDSLGLTTSIGPTYHAVSRCKKSLGFSQRPVLSTSDKLPA